MKRKVLISHLTQYGCVLLREGGRHSLYMNEKNGFLAAVPRHPEINDYLAKDICKELGIPSVGSN